MITGELEAGYVHSLPCQDNDDGNDYVYDHDDDLMITGELEAWYVHTLPTDARSAAGGLRARLEN